MSATPPRLFAKVRMQELVSVANLRRRPALPPTPQNFLNFMQFFWKFWQNRMLAPPGGMAPLLRGILDPPLSMHPMKFIQYLVLFINVHKGKQVPREKLTDLSRTQLP